jgi:hypothetical protein
MVFHPVFEVVETGGRNTLVCTLPLTTSNGKAVAFIHQAARKTQHLYTGTLTTSQETKLCFKHLFGYLYVLVSLCELNSYNQTIIFT